MALTESDRKELLLALEENKLLYDLFNHPGMKLFLGKAQEIYDTLDTVTDIKNMEDLYHKQGQMKELEWMLSFGDMVKDSLDHLLDQIESEVRPEAND